MRDHSFLPEALPSTIDWGFKVHPFFHNSKAKQLLSSNETVAKSVGHDKIPLFQDE